MEANYSILYPFPYNISSKKVLQGNVTWNPDQQLSNTTDQTALGVPDELLRDHVELIVLGILLGVIILMTILGNLLVMLAVMTNKKLQCPTNFFILSLAITDFFLGCTVLPFSAVNTLSSYWPLGSTFCNIFTSTDVMLCTVSILNLFAISLDRNFAVTSPMRYQSKITCKMVLKACACIWVFSFIMAFVPIHLGWNTLDGHVQNVNNPNICLFELNKVYVLLISIGTYFAPLLVMCGVYMRILLITKRQVQEINKLNKAGQATTMLSPGESRRQLKLASDTKATVTLASLVLAFAICWVPYFALFTAKPFIAININIHVDLAFLWLGYCNSMINPFLYAYYNSSFREAFARILCKNCIHRARYRSRLKAHHHHHLTSTFTDSSEMSALNGKASI